MKQRAWLSKTAFVAAIFVVVWIATIAYWKATYHPPSGTELLTYGIALPALLSAGLAWGRRAVGRLREAAAGAEGAAPAAAPSAPHASAARAVDEAAALAWTLALLDSSVRLPAGATTTEIDDAAREETAVGLHPALRRADGTGVFASGVASVSVDHFDEALLPPGSDAALNDEHARALLLAADVLDELLERHAVMATGNAARSAEPLKLHLLLPERWQPAAGALAAWLDAHVARERWMPGIERVQTRMIADPVQAWTVVDELIVSLHREPSNANHVVLACDSLLSDATVHTLDNTGRLYGHNRPDGRIPGEGACALLLAHPAAADAEDAPRVHRLVAGRSAAPDGAAAKSPADTLVRLLADARTQTAPPDLALSGCGLVSDADQRGGSRTEIAAAAERTWPDGARERCRHLGVANGESGAALALGAIAVAGWRATEEQQPTFAASIGDPVARGVMLVTPAPIASAAAPDLAAAAA
ncbi:hypothetical protein BTM_424 [Burkholderia thailandensis 34]|uniref:hypothetical protein n=1 Tax=Burkholderia thailandensis TaxID=57975 RepID=UPI0005D9D739|nr:hypothetical protein [Burkholderia thailandensis]AJY27044.1 hypothetical protein BTM_5979 [Burkholderia thailandensis 34]AJY30583.1 hypothetical protein BTM_424 [Burkholderia thailandensis 34]AOJ56478.1 hypothetical protein AQ477_08120 [Burkholderia thailandensis]KXF62225.1 hypothetical protein AQ476_13680 [Burkholderia thailandensis]PNE73271.1 hypothetical protein A8H37_14445 [Burkholderia thailandensis]